ncbi:aminoacyl-tRNA hydrolase [candidate division WOR-1 bacterium RIFOXYB2_FULL_42_35]|uniref:Peptidyl-tRNA hydrolase n=1 Tax=candidate division WOR-1 bacterium RIFOXYC2_FULL_41_25 TaxID=1802586 RepID=A0A1F4TQM4_UNCSA|nr:MAG: aminoacyl-tRNA hydrolase [candidate division WOR-1 bacterium RIFOXYA2_FULL_41_14]OGC25569.1 MAG: aminoacyl-tRNA hydrolase [candidate division WOR-1 bacterium RIFOXYB2_FULL_42_35]OGC35001.1 MAG: aminoacyl-tRNA hydrolase [candidate division WOR-1 bacterium RIFOXYC2_FULL_41_25]
MYLIVGLGNPGKEYENTRHNLGFRVIDELAARLKITSFKSKCQALIVKTEIDSEQVVLAKPQTFMNNSGLAVRSLMDWFKIKADKLILIYDDVDLGVGQLRLRDKGSAGGHHGIESVIENIGITSFIRVRIGLGRDNLTGDVADYVLAQIPKAEQESLALATTTAAEAVEAILAHGLAKAMNLFNK